MRLASKSEISRRFAQRRSASQRFASISSTRRRSAPLRSGRVLRLAFRHLFQAFTPFSFKSLTCSSSATAFAPHMSFDAHSNPTHSANENSGSTPRFQPTNGTILLPWYSVPLGTTDSSPVRFRRRVCALRNECWVSSEKIPSCCRRPARSEAER
jgi:hypothetical protein